MNWVQGDMMSLEQILKEIKEVKPFAEENVDNGPIETMTGRRGRKNQSIERLKQLKRQYTRDLMRTSQFIIVTGSMRDDLTDSLTKGDKGLFSADPEAFYKDLAGRVNPALYQGKSTVADLFDVLGRYLEDKASEIDIVEYPQLIFKERYVKKIDSVKQFTELVKLVINEQMGAEVVGIQSVNSIVDIAIDKNHASKSTTIVLNTEDPKLAEHLIKDMDRLTNRVVLAIAGESDIQTYDFKTDKINKESIKELVNILKSTKK